VIITVKCQGNHLYNHIPCWDEYAEYIYYDADSTRYQFTDLRQKYIVQDINNKTASEQLRVLRRKQFDNKGCIELTYDEQIMC
jgi:hypothetical protein